MLKRGLSQEGLKLIACLTMLLDHIGALLLPQYTWLRAVGRISFPIFCFMLAEDVHYTKNPAKYALRLLICAVISEIFFDYAVFGGFYMGHQNVMLALLIGFLMAMCMKYVQNPLLKVLLVVPFAFMAELAYVDYGGLGVVLMAMFVLTRNAPYKPWVQMAALVVIAYFMNDTVMPLAGVPVRIQLLAVFAMIPIALYSGRKETNSKTQQWAFYLFYPAHLAVLYLLWSRIL